MEVLLVVQGLAAGDIAVRARTGTVDIMR